MLTSRRRRRRKASKRALYQVDHYLNNSIPFRNERLLLDSDFSAKRMITLREFRIQDDLERIFPLDGEHVYHLRLRISESAAESTRPASSNSVTNEELRGELITHKNTVNLVSHLL